MRRARGRRAAALLAAVGALVLARAAHAQEHPIALDGWQPLAFPRIDRHTRYRVAQEGEASFILAESECSASGLLRPLAGVDLTATPLLRWRWRVDEAVAPGDERSRGGDDFAARVYVAFAFEPERATWLERAARRVATAVYGETLPGSSLDYVWAREEPVGARWPNPYAAETRMIVAASGPPAGWREAEADLLADYARAFSHPPPAPLFLAVMTDSDDSCSRARARYADFRFAPRPSTNESTRPHSDSKSARRKPLPVVSQSK